MNKALLKELMELTPEERIQLAEDLWDSISAEEVPPLTDFGYSRAVRLPVTLHVPADAKISLAGVDTKQSGDVRQFATTRLAAGQTWDGYKVVVEMNKNGQTLHEERTIKLVGGEAQELSVNFDSKAVAQN